ncbi:MAG: ferrous iron transport protein A [Suilimivivens sp.]|nr:FeoA domain-containing protein [Lachnospiraceae bacterium]
MSLFESRKGNDYEIKGLYVEEGITRRLQALGLNDGTVVTVLNRKRNGALIIRVRGTRLAIGKHISQGIEVEEFVR